MSAEPVSLSPVIDVRTIPPISRHATIFAMIDALEPGEALEIVNDHDPVPLRRQLETRNPGASPGSTRKPARYGASKSVAGKFIMAQTMNAAAAITEVLQTHVRDELR